MPGVLQGHLAPMISSLLRDGRKYQLGTAGKVPWEGKGGTENTTAHCQVQRLVGGLYNPHMLASDFMETLSLTGVPEKGGRLEVCGFGGLCRYQLGAYGVDCCLASASEAANLW